jgi:hypothetical protein
VTEQAEVSNPAPMTEQEFAARFIRPDAAERIAEWKCADAEEQARKSEAWWCSMFTPQVLAKLDAEEAAREAEEGKMLQLKILEEMAAEGDAGALGLLQSFANGEAATFEEQASAETDAPIPNFDFHFVRDRNGRIAGPVEIRGDDGSNFELTFSRDKAGRISSPFQVRRKDPGP